MSRCPQAYHIPQIISNYKKPKNPTPKIINDNLDRINEMLDREDYKGLSEMLNYWPTSVHPNLSSAINVIGRFTTDYNLMKKILTLHKTNKLHISFETTKRILKCGFDDLFISYVECDNVLLELHNQTIFKSPDPIKLLNIFSEQNIRLRLPHFKNAIIKNNIPIINYAIQMEYDIQKLLDDFAWASYTICNASMFKFLLSNGIEINKGNDIIIAAIKKGDLECVKILLPYTDINYFLQLSCLLQNIPIMTYILQMGADIDMINEDYISGQLRIDMLIFLNTCKVPISQNILNRSLLHKLIYDSDINTMKYCIDFGASVEFIFEVENKKNYHLYYLSNLEFITAHNKLDHIKFLCDKCWYLMEKELDRLMVIACANGRTEIVEYLYSLGISVNGFSLKVACFFGQLDIIKLLLNYGVDVNDVDDNLLKIVEDGYKCSPLYHITPTLYLQLIKDNDIFRNDMYFWGYGERKETKQLRNIMKYFVELGVQILPDSMFWYTIPNLILDEEVLMCYYNAGHDINIKNSSGKTMLEMFMDRDNATFVTFMLKLGAIKPSEEIINKFPKMKNILDAY